MSEITINNYKLDEEQLKPILENPKYSLIVAGAGSGKTLTILGKIKYLLDNHILKPDEICALSFTNEAVKNLNNNILKNCNVNVPTFTFHKLALTILGHDEYQVLPSDYLSYLIAEFFKTNCHNNQQLLNYYFKYHHVLFKTKKKYQALTNNLANKKLSDLIITFINLFKCNGYADDYWYDIIKKSHHHERYLLYLIYAIYLMYNEEKNSSKRIDFDDMINLATQKVIANKIKLKYKLIIIDEFQDTSLLRFNLIKAILDKTDACLCVVGDDYQSIYHFSGCDIDLFLNFKKYFPKAKIYNITNTYRNSQELIDVAGSFIMRNPYQIKKQLTSYKHIKKPIKIVYYRDHILPRLIQTLNADESIFILGRNSFDLKYYLKEGSYELVDKALVINKLNNYHLRYLTIHAAKGLEADNVIILNLVNNEFGLPSLKQDNLILRHVKKTLTYPYEEERRLFYVALTRAKRNVYLLVNQSNPSIFIKEIMFNKNVEVIKL
jgi:DNA helicase IV